MTDWSAIGKSSRAKGAQHERNAARILMEIFPGMEITRNGESQSRGKTKRDLEIVEGEFPFFLAVAYRVKMTDSVWQTRVIEGEDECLANGLNEIPICLFKQKQKPWRVAILWERLQFWLQDEIAFPCPTLLDRDMGFAVLEPRQLVVFRQ